MNLKWTRGRFFDLKVQSGKAERLENRPGTVLWFTARSKLFSYFTPGWKVFFPRLKGILRQAERLIPAGYRFDSSRVSGRKCRRRWEGVGNSPGESPGLSGTKRACWISSTAALNIWSARAEYSARPCKSHSDFGLIKLAITRSAGKVKHFSWNYQEKR